MRTTIFLIFVLILSNACEVRKIINFPTNLITESEEYCKINAPYILTKYKFHSIKDSDIASIQLGLNCDVIESNTISHQEFKKISNLDDDEKNSIDYFLEKKIDCSDGIRQKFDDSELYIGGCRFTNEDSKKTYYYRVLYFVDIQEDIVYEIRTL